MTQETCSDEVCLVDRCAIFFVLFQLFRPVSTILCIACPFCAVLHMPPPPKPISYMFFLCVFHIYQDMCCHI